MTLKEKSFTFPPQRTSKLTPAVDDDVEERELDAIVIFNQLQ